MAYAFNNDKSKAVLYPNSIQKTITFPSNLAHGQTQNFRFNVADMGIASNFKPVMICSVGSTAQGYGGNGLFCFLNSIYGPNESVESFGFDVYNNTGSTINAGTQLVVAINILFLKS